ncbi:toluene tolerance protein [Rhodocyclaceae bacterium]
MGRTGRHATTRCILIALDDNGYAALSAGASVIEADAFGPKVLLRPDGDYLKLFRRKRLLSSALWRPYARRFADNALALKTRGIPCPEVLAVYRQKSLARDIVHYRPLPGSTIRQLIAAGIADAAAESLRLRLRDFFAGLHGLGIYFRSAHLGNIVLMPDNRLGLIDIADLQLKNRPLAPGLRRRNYQHILRYPADREWLCISPGWAGLGR